MNLALLVPLGLCKDGERVKRPNGHKLLTVRHVMQIFDHEKSASTPVNTIKAGPGTAFLISDNGDANVWTDASLVKIEGTLEELQRLLDDIEERQKVPK
jgi:hypothetical protein